MKTAQIHMTETIAVLFIFFVLIFFGLVFYYNYSQNKVEEITHELVIKRAIDTTTKMIFMPEVQCTNGEIAPESYCMDLMKVRSLPAIINKNKEKFYFDLFSYARVTVQEVYPDPTKSWPIYDFPKKDFTSKEVTNYIVSLKDESVGQAGESAYGFGYVVVEVYS